MAADERRDLSGRRVDDADYSNARLHSANFEGTRFTDGYFVNADISADIDGLVINGVEIAPFVEAELDRRFPERTTLRATDPRGLAAAWELVAAMWATTVTRAAALPEPLLHVQVDGEWSFVETLRHLIFATDSWLLRMVRQDPRPYSTLGLAGSWMTDYARLGIDPGADPTFDEVLCVRRERMDAVRETVATLTADELERRCVPPAGPGHPTETCSVRKCLHVILNEEWEHHRYANRDLDVLVEGA